MSEDNFFSRWSRRKAHVQSGVAPVRDEPAPTAPVAVPAPTPAVADNADAPVDGAAAPGRQAAVVPPSPPPPPPPTLADVAQLTPESSYARFVGREVDPAVKNAAMKKLFTDPHYNVMDGLDIYIDDYGKPDPIPLSMLRQMNQAHALGLFDHEKQDKPPAADPGAATAHPTAADTATDVDADAAPSTATPGAVAEADASAPAPSTDPETLPHDHPDLQLQPDDGAGRSGAGQGADHPPAA